MSYTLKLDVTGYQLAVVHNALITEINRAERDNRSGPLFPSAVTSIANALHAYTELRLNNIVTCTLKLDLTEYEMNVLETVLQRGVAAAERDGVDDAPYPTAMAEALEMIRLYRDAAERAKEIARTPYFEKDA